MTPARRPAADRGMGAARTACRADRGAGSWLLITAADADPLTKQLSDALVTGGAQCRTAHVGADTEVSTRDLTADGVTAVVIVAPPADGEPTEGCLSRGRELVASRAHRPRAVGHRGQPPRLYVITRNAQPVTPHDRINLDHGGLRGLLRVIGAENPPLRPTQIDVDADTTADLVAQEMLSGSDEDETAWRAERGTGRGCSRRRCGPRSGGPPSSTPNATACACRSATPVICRPWSWPPPSDEHRRRARSKSRSAPPASTSPMCWPPSAAARPSTVGSRNSAWTSPA